MIVDRTGKRVDPMRAAIYRISQAFGREMPALTLDERRELLVLAGKGIVQQIALIDKANRANGYVAPPTEEAKQETAVVGKGTRSSDAIN